MSGKPDLIAMNKVGGIRSTRMNKPKLQNNKKIIVGKIRCIYKITGDRNEYVKCSGKLVTVKNYKSIMKKPKN
jgi:hypothetical protein